PVGLRCMRCSSRCSGRVSCTSPRQQWSRWGARPPRVFVWKQARASQADEASGYSGAPVRPAPARLRETLRWGDGLALVVGIMVGAGIFRTPGLIASMLGRPVLTFVAWALGGAVGLLGALVFAELSTRHPHAGGKYVYARESFGRRAGFVVGWIETLTYCAAVAAIGVVSGDYLSRLVGWPPRAASTVGVLLILALTAVHLVGVRLGTMAQNVVTGAKVLAL